MKNMQRIFTLGLLLLFKLTALAQTEDEYWATWNKNYPETDILEVLRSERKYADSVEKDPKLAPYYYRTDKYRFVAEYLGETRKIDTAVLHSIKRVHKLKGGDPSQIESLVKSEVLFNVGDKKIWMPVQTRIVKAIKEEAKKGEQLMLYCAFFNEHTRKKKLYNSLLISEFSK
jgi:N-acetyl-beta-hexosaminidase